ncbi:MAG TPA: hypothetical protein VF457_16580 [Burkholderiaceae bacterium]
MTATTLPRLSAALQDAVLTTAEALARRRAGEIPEQTIARLVALRWLEWAGGRLRFTAAGEEVLMKAQAAVALDEPEAA